ncbi:diacylglycerol kinase family lipid kinase [Sphingomonas piscis]|uniref:Diacylglycerol kinase family lipid kinase n=1 Tax=Sphingomonas piscis TaxID=2714943 RepID=A0A6G7YQN0_9SPHN|nr:diacylglycerol kinase family protein [Sphingomonas piscis]QIK79037.1 diacylglycerol kinase family lipid kinase [Sphingomonas piscis]
MTSTALTVVINAAGGAASADAAVEQTVRDQFEAVGIAADFRTGDADTIRAACKEAKAGAAKAVVVGGGDGSISLAASELCGSDTALGILPLGTLNHFARDLAVGTTVEEAVGTIAAGHSRRVDLAELNGRTFINNSAIGLYPLMVFDREAQQKRLGRSKRLAMIVASLHTLARFDHQRLTLTVDGRRRQVDTPLLFVGNNDYLLELPRAGQRDRLDDGKLCVLVMRSKSRRAFAAATLRALLGRTRPDDMVRLDEVEELIVESRRSRLRVALDGEVEHLPPPLTYRIRRAALTVLAPPPADQPRQ